MEALVDSKYTKIYRQSSFLPWSTLSYLKTFFAGGVRHQTRWILCLSHMGHIWCLSISSESRNSALLQSITRGYAQVRLGSAKHRDALLLTWWSFYSCFGGCSKRNSFNIFLDATVLEGLRSADTCCLNCREFWNIGYQVCSSAAGKLSQSVAMRGVEIEFGIDRLVLIRFKAAQVTI